MKVTTYQFENLYAWYSWPNVILPIIGGYFVDNVFGMRLATIVFTIFILLGG
jgi:dipeptide/tripeptide permease